MFKCEKARMECSGVSGFATYLYVWHEDFYRQMEFLQVFCNVDESFSLLYAKSNESPKKKRTINVKNEE